jgi:hypothetical protein
MAIISKDFLVKNGLVVSTTATVQSETDSLSTTTGALIVSGGAGIGGNLHVGGEIVAHKLTVEYTTVTQTQVTSPDIFTITNTTVSISTDSGALTVAGGVGIGGDLYVGGGTNLSGITLGPSVQFPIKLAEDQLSTTYDPITTSTVLFADGTIQGSRPPIAWTNSLFISVANYYSIDPGIVFSPTVLGGFVQVGDTYFDDGSFGGDGNHIYIMVDQGNGVVQFLDITPLSLG